MRLTDVVLVGFEPGPGTGRGTGRDLQGGARASPIDTRRRSGDGRQVDAVHRIYRTADRRPGDGRIAERQRSAAVPHRGDAGVFRILGIEILQGRGFTPDDERGAPVVIVNQTMARTVWPGESALGKCIRIGFDPSFDPLTASGPPGPPTTVACREVVGVSRDVRQRSIVPNSVEDRLMQYFVPFSQVPGPPAGVGPGPGIRGCWCGRIAANSLIARFVARSSMAVPICRLSKSARTRTSSRDRWGPGVWVPRSCFSSACSRSGSRVSGLCGLRACHRRAPPRDGDPHRGRGPTGPRAGNDSARSGPSCGGRGAVGCAFAVVAGRWLESMLSARPRRIRPCSGRLRPDALVAGLATFLPARLRLLLIRTRCSGLSERGTRPHSSLARSERRPPRLRAKPAGSAGSAVSAVESRFGRLSMLKRVTRGPDERRATRPACSPLLTLLTLWS